MKYGLTVSLYLQCHDAGTSLRCIYSYGKHGAAFDRVTDNRPHRREILRCKMCPNKLGTKTLGRLGTVQAVQFPL